MQIGDIVLALDGCDYLLGIAKIEENVARYKKSLLGVFFDHVRIVSWVLAYDYDKSVPLPHALDRFTNTLRRVDVGERYWNDLAPLQISADQVSEPIKRTQLLGVRKYGSGGEGSDHKKLKEWIADNPDSIGLRNVRRKAIEYPFPSGDIADIVFDRSIDRPREHSITEGSGKGWFPERRKNTKRDICLGELDGPLSLWHSERRMEKTKDTDKNPLKHGNRQTVETLINEEALLLAKYLRNERQAWVPRIGAYKFSTIFSFSY